MGEPPPGLTLERMNVNGNYEPENCIWADKKTQRRNRTDSKRITLCGKSIAYPEACKEFGMSVGTLAIYARLQNVSYVEMFYTILDRKLSGDVIFPGVEAKQAERRQGYPPGKTPRAKQRSQDKTTIATQTAPTTTTVSAPPATVTTTTGTTP